MKYQLKKYKSGKMIKMSWTSKKRKFFNILRTINFKSEEIKAYIRIEYGKAIDNKGKKVTFYNDGYYFTQQDLMFAYQAFNEVDRI